MVVRCTYNHKSNDHWIVGVHCAWCLEIIGLNHIHTNTFIQYTVVFFSEQTKVFRIQRHEIEESQLKTVYSY